MKKNFSELMWMMKRDPFTAAMTAILFLCMVWTIGYFMLTMTCDDRIPTTPSPTAIKDAQKAHTASFNREMERRYGE